MKLLTLELKRFGRFEDYRISFSDGFNVLLGDNEAGKSTIVEAIGTILFDDPAKLPGEPSSYANWKQIHPFLLHLEYEHAGKIFRLTKDVSTEITLLEEVESGSKWNSPKEIQAELAKALGFGEKDFYRASSLVRQGDLSHVTSGADIIKDKLEGLLNSNKDELLASQLMDKLKRRLEALLGTPGTSAGEISSMEKKLAEWKQELDLCKTKTIELFETRRRHQNIQSELQVTQKLFEDKHDLFKKSKLAFEAEQNLEKEREVFLDLNRRTKDALEIKNSITTKKETLKSMTKIERGDLKSTETLATQNQLNLARVQDAEEILEKEKQAVHLAQPKGWYRILSGCSLVVAFICGYLGHSSQHPIFSGVAALAFLTSLVSIILWFSAVRSYRAAVEKQKDAQTRLEREKENFKKSDETLKALLLRYNVKDVEEMAEKYEEYRDLDRDNRSLVARYETLLGENNLKDLENDLAKMNSRMEKQQETFNKYRSYAISQQKLEQLQKEVEQLDKKLSQMHEEATSFDHKLKFIEAGSDLMAPLQERIEYAEKQMGRYRRDAGVVTIISRYLEEARRKVLKSSLELVEEEVTSLFKRLSEGLWTKVRLDRRTMAAEVSADGSKWMSADSCLSHTAKEALCLSLRLALVRVISGEKRPPLVLEDPLVYFDEKRRNKALAILKEMSASHQILFLTADRSYSRFADRLTTLETVSEAFPSQPVASV